MFYTVPLFYQQDSLSLSDICSCMRMSGIKDIPGECSSLHCCVPDEMRRRHFSLQVLTGYGQNAEQRWGHVRLPVNSSHGQLVTRSTRHTVNSSQVSSSPGRLVTQSTRHKEAVNSSQANIKAVLPTMYWSPNFLAIVFKTQKNSQQVVTRMQDFTSEFSKIFRG